MGSMGMYSSSMVSDSSILRDLLLVITGFFLGGSEVGSGGSRRGREREGEREREREREREGERERKERGEKIEERKSRDE